MRFFILVLALALTSFSFAEKITTYKIDVNVEQSGELAITESIEYDFEGQKKHGIYRDIPFIVKRNNIKKDLELYDFKVEMDNTVVDWEKSTLKSANAGKVIRLKIGNASTYVQGKRIYIITYRVKMGVLPASQNENDDAIRWNIIGTGWKIPIENIRANFFLPSSLIQNNIELSTYTGVYGEKSSKATYTWINPQQVEIIIKKLHPQEGATVELSYPAGILNQSGLGNVEASFIDWFLGNWHWGALFGFLYYFREMYKSHRGFVDNRSIATQYEPPKDLSLLQSGLILDKFADNEDFSAAMIELASLGYLTIEQKDKRYNPILIRTDKKDTNLTMDQKYLLNVTLFKKDKTFVMSESSKAKASILQDGFSDINKNLYTWSVADGYMSQNPQKERIRFLWKSFLWLLPVLALVIYTLLNRFGAESIFILMFPLMFGGVGISVMFGSKQWSGKIFGFVFILAGMMPLFVLKEMGLGFKELFLGPIGVFIILIVVLFITYKKLGRFTKKGAYASKHLLGLKEFISRVKEDEIKRRLEADPLYLDKLLPYAVLFKETDHWLNFYDTLNISTPHWYNGKISNMNNFSSSVNSTSTPPSQGSGGSGFSGAGGFSGGGGGGGGGGSW